MVSFPVRSYSCNAMPSLNRQPQPCWEYRQIHDDFREVEQKIDETRQSIGKKQPQEEIEQKLDKLDLQLHKVHPEVTEITEEAYLSPEDKKLVTVESNFLTDKLNTLTERLPDKLRNKAARLTESQKMFQALMNFEFHFGKARNPEKDDNRFDRELRRLVNETMCLIQAEKFGQPGMKRLKAETKPATGLAY